MSILAPARYWLDQARADLAAAGGRVDGIRECHRRYWLQQAYEKALKSLLVALVSPDEPAGVLLFVRDTVMRSHSPLGSLAEFADGLPEEAADTLQRRYPLDWERGMKVVRLLKRQGAAFIGNRHGSQVLSQIDRTKPSIAATTASYRYPFFENGQPTTPASWRGWNEYQGDEDEVVAAVRELTEEVGKTIPLVHRNRVKAPK